MKIIASSIQQAADLFLHAGYISAYPRSVQEYDYGNTPPVLQVEVGEALRLKGEVLASHVLPDSGLMAAPASASDWSTLVWGAVGLAAATGLVLLLLPRGRRRGAPWLAAARSWAAASLIVLAVVRCGGLEPLPTDAPWAGVTLKEYNDPAAATRVLLHGIIADGIANVGQPIDMLENIQNEVGLPTTRLTAGEAYALKTYGIDGWGRGFRLSEKNGAYTVTSAGEDGKMDTADDIKLDVRQSSDESFDTDRAGFFVRRSGTALVVLFHRWTGEHFLYRHRDQAASLTGRDLFDLFDETDLGSKKDQAEQAYQAVASSAKHEAIVLQVFRN